MKRVLLAMLVIVLVELVHVAVLLRLAQRAGSQERLHTTFATTARAHHVALELLQPPTPIRPQSQCEPECGSRMGDDSASSPSPRA